MSTEWNYVCDYIAQKFTTCPGQLLVSDLARILSQDEYTIAKRFDKLHKRLSAESESHKLSMVDVDYISGGAHETMPFYKSRAYRHKTWFIQHMSDYIRRAKDIFKAINTREWEYICDYLAAHFTSRPHPTLVTDLRERGLNSSSVTDAMLHTRFQLTPRHRHVENVGYEVVENTMEITTHAYIEWQVALWTWDLVQSCYVAEAKGKYRYLIGEHLAGRR